MDYLKTNLIRKVSRLSRRRKTEKSHHPYRTRFSESVDNYDAPEMREVPSPEYDKELASIKLTTDCSFSGLQFNNAFSSQRQLSTTAMSTPVDHNNLSLKNTEFIPITNLSLPRKITDENMTPETSCHLTGSLPVIALNDSHLTPAAIVGDGLIGVTSLTDELKALGQSSQKRRKLGLNLPSRSQPSSEEKRRLTTIEETPLSRVKRSRSMKEFTMDFALGRYGGKSKRASHSQSQLPRAASLNTLNSQQTFGESHTGRSQNKRHKTISPISKKLRHQPSCSSQAFTTDSMSRETPEQSDESTYEAKCVIIGEEGTTSAEGTTPLCGNDANISILNVGQNQSLSLWQADHSLCNSTDIGNSFHREDNKENTHTLSALESLFPSGKLPTVVINPLQSPSRSRQLKTINKQNGTSNLFEKFRRRAGKSRLFSSFRGRNERHSTHLENLTDTKQKSPPTKHPGSTTRKNSDKTGAAMELPAHVSTDTIKSTSVSRQTFPQKVLLSPDKIDIRQIGTPERKCKSETLPLDTGIIPPPTPFRMLVTTTDSDNRLQLKTTSCTSMDSLSCDSIRSSDDESSPRAISSNLKKEIEMSLLHWPVTTRNTRLTRSLRRPTRSTKTLPPMQRNASKSSLTESLHLQPSRPLSWSYDTSQSLSAQLTPNQTLPSTQSNYSLSRRSRGRPSPLASRPESPLSSTLGASGSKSSLESCEGMDTTFSQIDRDDSCDTFAESEEFMDAVSALQTFERRVSSSYCRDNRRMSQPHPIKSRSRARLRSDDSASSFMTSSEVPANRRPPRQRSKSEPSRLVHEDIRQNFHKDLSKICTVVGDIASFDGPNQRHYSQQVLSIADPLWHHVTHEAEELSFHVGDIIMVLDMRDKDWWWGRRAPPSGHWSQSDSSETEESGWFPSTFVRLRANQAVTTDELIEDIKSGTADTASVVQQYSSSLLSRNQARCNVVNEILTAERDYVKHLRDIVQGFIEKARERTEMFTEKQISLIFGNISEIYDVAQEFLQHLEKTISDSESAVHYALIGKCFLEHKDQFEVYSAYCNNHPRALEELQSLNKDSKYKHFFEACRMLQNMIPLALDGFLLTPIQKICKYPLQLTELLKYTNTEHEDYKSLQEALGAMKDMAMLINERKRKLESIQKIAEWQNTVDDWQDDDILVSSSELIHSGELSKLSSAGRLVERHFFLFDHQLFQCKKELLKKSLIYKSRIDLDTHSVTAIEDGKAQNSSTYLRNAVELRDEEGTTVLTLSAKTAADKEKWLKSFSTERDIVRQDKENGFAVTESFKALAKLSTPVKSSKPSKTNSLGRQQSETKTAPDIMDSKDKTVNNNKLAGIKQKSSNGLINKLKKARIVT